MKHNRILILAAVAVISAGLMTSCKSSGMAMTSRGQLFKINIYAPSSLTEGSDANVDVVLSNRGVNDVDNILTDVQLPPQLIVGLAALIVVAVVADRLWKRRTHGR